MKKRQEIREIIKQLEEKIDKPEEGLQDDIFYFISRITPMVNIDLLIKDQQDRVLLSWRDTEFSGSGWHIPGGIIRFKESLENRIQKVAQAEIGSSITYNPTPLAINQIEKKHKTRGHFISFLYQGAVPENYRIRNKNKSKTENGFLKWHKTWPENLIQVHKTIYNNILKNAQINHFKNPIKYHKI